MADLNELVRTAEQGDPLARQQLFALLYDELHRVAQRELKARGGALGLSPTTVLHESYLSFFGRDSTSFATRAQFLAYAARAMRGLIIDYARNRHAQKRGGAFEITSLPTEIPEQLVDDRELARVGEALDALLVIDSALGELVELKFFCGFSFAEIAALRGSSERTVQRDWAKARILLHREMTASEAPD
jgi:RNA polymerase sigma factor (TIGR02999 family)